MKNVLFLWFADSFYRTAVNHSCCLYSKMKAVVPLSECSGCSTHVKRSDMNCSPTVSKLFVFWRRKHAYIDISKPRLFVDVLVGWTCSSCPGIHFTLTLLKRCGAGVCPRAPLPNTRWQYTWDCAVSPVSVSPVINLKIVGWIWMLTFIEHMIQSPATQYPLLPQLVLSELCRGKMI